MLKRLTAVLYFVTAVATLDIRLADFDFVHAMSLHLRFKWVAFVAIIHFAAPTLFLLASVSALRRSDESKAPKWITAIAMLMVLALVFVHFGLGWRSYSEAAGTLVSFVLIVGSSVSRASTIAVIGAATYLVIEVPLLITSLEMYWDFGGSIEHFVAKIIPPIFVLASLVIAITSHFITRERIALAAPHSARN